MRKFLQLIILVGGVFISALVFAKSGPPIPAPQVTAIEAITIAQDFFYNKEIRIIDGGIFKLKDYVLISAQYTNDFNNHADEEWGWRIKFQHPIQNDHSLLYKITNDRKIVFLYASE